VSDNAVVVTRRDLLGRLGGLLVEEGFRKRAGLVFTVALADDVLGWLGLNEATKYAARDEVYLNPVVGLRHQGIERMIAELRAEKFHAYEPPTIATPLGYLMPEHAYREWPIGPDDFPEKAGDMVGAIREHGMRFLRDNASLAGITEQLEAGLTQGDESGYSLPVAYFLAGRPDSAMRLLARELDGLGGRDDPAATHYRRFAERFRARSA
jgi:hypothetical protein